MSQPDVVCDALERPAPDRSAQNANLQHGRLEHGAYPFVRRGLLPAGELGDAIAFDLDVFVGALVAGGGGESYLTVVDRVELEQVRSARGARLLLEAWAGTKQSLTHPKHGRLPRAISEDWHKFAKLERDLTASLRARFVDVQTKPQSAIDYFNVLVPGDDVA